MLNRNWKVAASVLLCGTLVACKTLEPSPVASDTTPTRALSSLCQIDAPLGYEPGAPGEADPMNELDSDATVTAIQEHNARYRAACAPSP